MEQHINSSWSYDGPPPFNHGGGGGYNHHHRRFHNNNNNYHDFNDDSFGYSNGPAFSGRKRPFSHFSHPPPEYFDDDGRSNKLYVSSVPREVTEEDIHSLFGKHGTITEVVLFKQLKNLQQHGTICFFFIYDTNTVLLSFILNERKEKEKKRKRTKGNERKEGYVIVLQLCPHEKKLYVEYLFTNYSRAHHLEHRVEFGLMNCIFLLEFMHEYPHYNINELKSVYPDCCFVKYATIEDATQAIEALHNQYTFPGRLRPIEVRYATKKPERPGPGFLKTHENKFFGHENKVFVGSLNKYASKAEIAAIFSPYGFVENVFLNYDEQRQCRGTGFITFSDRAMAADAINGLNGKYVMKGCDQPLVVRFAEPKKPRVWENRYPPYFNDPWEKPEEYSFYEQQLENWNQQCNPTWGFLGLLLTKQLISPNYQFR
ncbi:hypothetical protein M8C21_013391 [Ambrosia artemisiifolia]|uniref:RRM domain-containing protein n=1 Tax=Ambrosia artemisiifolia TaxID=4212 RepID=A0AAD5D181_AMBAR|nr:hypothetical protein M8C21_013391 [Ambrosia artemisiifolia]